MISDQVKAVILKVLDLDEFPLLAETLASEVPGWDSLSHIRVLTAIEDAFGIRFKGNEVLGLKNVGQLDALVQKKRAGG